MAFTGLLILALTCGLVSGCVKFPMVGSHQKEVFIGTANYNTLSGTSTLQLEGRAKKVRCEGRSHASYAPLFTLSGAGYGGQGELSCSDGSFFKVRWESLSWSRGIGLGRDKNGREFTFVYGMDGAEAEAFFAKEMPAALKRLE